MADPEDRTSQQEELSAVVKDIGDKFTNGEVQSALEAVEELCGDLEKLVSYSFDLVPIVSKLMTSEERQERPELFVRARRVLERFCEACSPQETYLELLEQAEDDDDLKFLEMLKLIQICLLRMPNHRGKSICWVCDTIVKHLVNMSKPEDHEGSEPQVEAQIVTVYEGVLSFLDPFVREVAQPVCPVRPEHLQDYRNDLMKCLIKSLGPPLVDLNLSTDSPHRALAFRILNLINGFVQDPLSLLNHVTAPFECVEFLEEDAVSNDFNNVALGCYFYLVFEEADQLSRISHVLTPNFILERCLVLVLDLMGSCEAPTTIKALGLCDSALLRVAPNTVDLHCIGEEAMIRFLESLVRNMVHNDSKTIRQTSVQLFSKFLDRLTIKGKHIVLLNADRLSPDSGFIGHCVTICKEQFHQALTTRNEDRLKYFTGTSLINFLSRYCRVGKLVEADLQAHTDQIVSCLNFLRYLLIRDKTHEARLSSYLKQLDELYLEPVQSACHFARGLYNSYKDEVGSLESAKFQLSVLGADNLLPEVSPEEQLAQMNSALTRIDMIEYLASRVSQCLAEYKQSPELSAGEPRS